MAQKIERIPTYIDGIDEEIEGGVPKGFVNLVRGVSGTMKSSVIFNIIYNEALKGKSSFYVSIEQSFDNLAQHLNNLGMDLSKINIALVRTDSTKMEPINKAQKSKGTIIFLDIPSIRQKIVRASKYGDLITLITNMIGTLAKTLKYDYFVLDSLNAIYAISDIKKPRETLFNIFEFLRVQKLTSYLILEDCLNEESYGEYGIEDYLADSVIALSLARYDRIVQREIIVRKMRATKSNTNVFTFSFKNGKFIATEGGRIPVLDFNER
ncbi:MAG: ATPase domain-containing protein [Nanoarchaeota archaeon]